MMERVILCARLPEKGYFGGVATIVKQYMDEAEQFKINGIQLELFNYRLQGRASLIANSKIKEIVYSIQQRKELVRRYSTNNGNTVIHIQTSRKWTLLKDLLLARTAKLKCKLPTVMTIHFADIDGILYKNHLLRHWQISLMKRYVDHIIFLSKKTAGQFSEVGYPIKRIFVEYTFHSFDMQDRNTCAKKGVELLFVGSLDKRKGIIELLSVLKEIPNGWHLTVCGAFTNDEIKKEYDRLAYELGNKIDFRGYVSGKEKRSVFSNADVLVLPSYGEGMPIVIMEAMAAGCAVLATKVGAIPEVVTERNGILIEPGKKEQLYNAILTYVTDAKMLKKIQENNQEYASRFHISKHIVRLCEIYKET